MPQVDRRIANLQKQREEAQALLDEALLDDAARAERDVATKARSDALNAMPQRKTRADGASHFSVLVTARSSRLAGPSPPAPCRLFLPVWRRNFLWWRAERQRQSVSRYSGAAQASADFN